MEKYDIFMIGLAIGVIIGLLMISAFYMQIIPSKRSELQSQFNSETRRVMPDEINLNNSVECIENKTIEYFAGFNATKCPEGLSPHDFWVNYCYINSVVLTPRIKAPIQNRTYCIKAIEVIRR